MQCWCLYSGGYDTALSVNSLKAGSHSATWGYDLVPKTRFYRCRVRCKYWTPLLGMDPSYQNTKHKSPMCWVNHYFFKVNEEMTWVQPIRMSRPLIHTDSFMEMQMTQAMSIKAFPRTTVETVKEEEPYVETLSTKSLCKVDACGNHLLP